MFSGLPVSLHRDRLPSLGFGTSKLAACRSSFSLSAPAPKTWCPSFESVFVCAVEYSPFFGIDKGAVLQEARVFNDPHLDARPQTMRNFLLRLLLIRRVCFANSHFNTRVSQSAIELAVEPPSFTVFFLYTHQSDALAFTLGYGNIQYKCSS